MSTDTKAYLDRNALGYEGDEFVHEEIKKLVDKFKVDLIVETGTFLGNTTKRLREFGTVFTCEIDETNYKKAYENLKYLDNLNLAFDDSVKFLEKLLPNSNDLSILFFLDAHWWDACPLLDELKVIADNGIKPVIVIHDWKVPNRPDLGFDSYKGQDFTFEWIEQSLKNIYGNNFKYHYNDQASGAKRGLIYIYPND